MEFSATADQLQYLQAIAMIEPFKLKYNSLILVLFQVLCFGIEIDFKWLATSLLELIVGNSSIKNK